MRKINVARLKVDALLFLELMVIEDAGSYCRVRSEEGIVAFIAADAIKTPDVAGPQAAPDPVLDDGDKPKGD